MKKKRRLRNKRRRPVNVLASVLTTINLYLGIMSIFASIGNEYRFAAGLILAGIVFDMLDGFVARITHSQSEFGKELDSLCDVVTFGLAPAVLVFMIYLPGGQSLPPVPADESIVGKTGSYMAIIYAICAALRLARFNVYQADQREFFVGLPTPAAGATIATFVLFLRYFEARLAPDSPGLLAYYALGPVAVLLAVLMVSNVLYPKNRAKAFILNPRHAFTSLAFAAFVIGIIHYAITESIDLVLFPVTAAYVLFGLGDTAYMKWRSRHEKESEDPTALAYGGKPAGPSGESSKTENAS